MRERRKRAVDMRDQDLGATEYHKYQVSSENKVKKINESKGDAGKEKEGCGTEGAVRCHTPIKSRRKIKAEDKSYSPASNCAKFPHFVFLSRAQT